jgi:hypothetical protein
MADLVILFTGNNISDFPSPANGQMALQANTGQTWAYLGGKWHPVTGFKPITLLNPYTVYIGGVGRDCQIEQRSLKVKKNLTSKVDTVSFTMLDDGDTSNRPVEGQQIDIFEYATTTKIFSGEINKIVQNEDATGNLIFKFKITGTDYTKRLNKRLITESYTNEKAGDIIKDFIGIYFPEFTTINVEDGPTIASIEFNYITGLNALKKVAKQAGYDWFVDPTKDIHFFLPSTNYAPYSLTEIYNNPLFVVDSSNKYFDFNIGGGELNATVSEGTYAPGNTQADSGTLCEAIYNAIVAAEGVGTYTVTYSDSTQKFTITRSAGTFNILWKTGTHGSDNTDDHIGTLIGYNDTADDTGSLSYTSDFPVGISGHNWNLKISRDKTNYRNRVVVQGGYRLEAYNDDIKVADGEQTTFNLAYEPFSPVLVYVDTGSGFVQKTLGIDNINTGFVIDSNNKYLDFNIGGGELNATVSEGTYAQSGNSQADSGTLCEAIYNAIVAAEGVGTYTVTYSDSTNKFTITRSAGTFNILWKTGTHGSDNTDTHIGTLIGFDDTADDTGSLSYTSDNALTVFDFVLNQTEKVVRNLNLPKLSSGDKIKVTYNKKIRIIVTREDTAAQAAIQAIEGGDGIYEYRLTDDTLTTEQAVIDRADAEIADFKDAQITGSFITDQVGYEEGQILRVNLPTWNYPNKEYKIQSVGISPITFEGEDGRALTVYNIVFRSFERSFEEFMFNLYNNSTNKEIPVIGDEVPVT